MAFSGRGVRNAADEVLRPSIGPGISRVTARL
jgi:hypothetical protein